VTAESIVLYYYPVCFAFWNGFSCSFICFNDFLCVGRVWVVVTFSGLNIILSLCHSSDQYIVGNFTRIIEKHSKWTMTHFSSVVLSLYRQYFPWKFFWYPSKYYRVDVDVKNLGSCGLEVIYGGLGSDPVLKLWEVVWPIAEIKDSEYKREAEPGELINAACSHLICRECLTTWTHVMRYSWFTSQHRIICCCTLLLEWNKKAIIIDCYCRRRHHPHCHCCHRRCHHKHHNLLYFVFFETQLIVSSNHWTGNPVFPFTVGLSHILCILHVWSVYMH
jgi:hypothetical protein